MATQVMIAEEEFGCGKHPVTVNEIQIPDLWHIAMRLSEPDQKAVLDAWHLAHDLLNHLKKEDDRQELIRVGKALCQRPRA